MKKGENVLIFADIVSSGTTAKRLAKTLLTQYEINIIGLVTLADIRSKKIRKNDNEFEDLFKKNVITLFNDAVEDEVDKLEIKYYLHPVNLVIQKIEDRNNDEQFKYFLKGVGVLGEKYFNYNNSTALVNLLTKNKSINYGHFEDGNHHSEIFIDYEKIFNNRGFLISLVTSIFQYIINNKIQLIIYPSHSSIYYIIDELKHKFRSTNLVHFKMACRTTKDEVRIGYSMLDSYQEGTSDVQELLTKPILILDVSIFTGTTIKGILSEISRLIKFNKKLKDQTENKISNNNGEQASEIECITHIIIFANRMSKPTCDFWSGLKIITNKKIQFSSFISIPNEVYSKTNCPLCNLTKRIQTAYHSNSFCHYSREFLSWWESENMLITTHERKHLKINRKTLLSSEEIFRLSKYLSIIQLNIYDLLKSKLYEQVKMPAQEESVLLKTLVRSRMVFHMGIVIQDDSSSNENILLGNEIQSLLSIIFNAEEKDKKECILLFLRELVQRYLFKKPSFDEIEAIITILFSKLTFFVETRLVFDGIVALIDSWLQWYEIPETTTKARESVFNLILKEIEKVDTKETSESSEIFIEWLKSYCNNKNKKVGSIGQAVLTIADYINHGKPNHYYLRSELDDLFKICDGTTEEKFGTSSQYSYRILISSNDFLTLLSVTKVLLPINPDYKKEINILLTKTEDLLREMQKLEVKKNNKEIELNEEDYNESKIIFRQLYKTWFASDHEFIDPTHIIDHYKIRLADEINQAIETFIPDKNKEFRLNINIEEKVKNSPIQVLVDRRAFSNGFKQILENIHKHSLDDASSSNVIINFKTYNDTNNSQIVMRNQFDSLNTIEISIVNDNTYCVSLKDQKLSGLAKTKLQLNEFGGDLVWKPCFDDQFTFEVVIKLVIWTELIK
ncbi:MAG: phosphoribosyltransferase [Bacteroidetes bacterium]|nr:phosphoribosyltransferase [Bacteroidota bacterium]